MLSLAPKPYSHCSQHVLRTCCTLFSLLSFHTPPESSPAAVPFNCMTVDVPYPSPGLCAKLPCSHLPLCSKERGAKSI
ncbi:hypothetical protein L207DRAFT_195928 [Hyaloscypha variabilis F]|uniref:Uncharacterized protein n=1 Tax=Hyaloscypha variabilis (strain UAMH 11265 / GT02V1 / F) TaxID=1149755 RepID=A0A2J6QXG8_HYAVF|nr:hypothetical protein L207DRAFT_195928 [Hyaloscypha variabilis F]